MTTLVKGTIGRKDRRGRVKPNRGVRRKQVSMVSEEGTGEVQQGSEEVEFRRKAKCLRGDRREQLESSS